MLAPEDLIQLHDAQIERDLRERELIREAADARGERRHPLSAALRRYLSIVGRRLAGGDTVAHRAPSGPSSSRLPARSSAIGAPGWPGTARGS